jgi:hypothetical protein
VSLEAASASATAEGSAITSLMTICPAYTETVRDGPSGYRRARRLQDVAAGGQDNETCNRGGGEAAEEA